MKVKELMTQPVIQIAPGESVSVAARTLTHYNIGALPVCNAGGQLCGMVTDRDLVIRCMAAGKDPGKTAVREVMTGKVACAAPDMDVGAAAHLMGRQQVRRLPVMEGGRLCGMLSLGDLTKREETAPDAADVLADVTDNISRPDGW
jgi:CBS domain-containing protein